MEALAESAAPAAAAPAAPVSGGDVLSFFLPLNPSIEPSFDSRLLCLPLRVDRPFAGCIVSSSSSADGGDGTVAGDCGAVATAAAEAAAAASALACARAPRKLKLATAAPECEAAAEPVDATGAESSRLRFLLDAEAAAVVPAAGAATELVRAAAAEAVDLATGDGGALQVTSSHTSHQIQ